MGKLKDIIERLIGRRPSQLTDVQHRAKINGAQKLAKSLQDRCRDDELWDATARGIELGYKAAARGE